MAMFRKIVARESWVDAVRARLAKGADLDLIVSDTPENAIDDVLESFAEDLRWNDDPLLNVPDKENLDWYEIEKYDDRTNQVIVIGWQFIAY